jgi:hypothetical protein
LYADLAALQVNITAIAAIVKAKKDAPDANVDTFACGTSFRYTVTAIFLNFPITKV